MPASLQALWKAAVRALGLPSLSANSILAKLPDCLITPGSMMCEAMRATPGTTLLAPTILPMRSALSTPFWNVNTVAPPATSAFRLSAAVSVSPSLTAKMMASAAGISRGIGHHLHRFQVQLADVAVEAQAVLAHRRQVRAARHERHVVAGRRQPRAEVAADPAGSHHRDFHSKSPCAAIVPALPISTVGWVERQR